MVYMQPKRKHGEDNENKPKMRTPPISFSLHFHMTASITIMQSYMSVPFNRAFLKFRLGFKRNFVLNKEFEE
ncbi:hypothetical protein CJP14_06940 [Bacillus velezensis]|nr:hypothetical protein U722_09315 [Bacillus amyloliquefaciens LFB112]AIU77183.1 hypothetical protein MA22_11860 [Bacillus subtilis]ALV01467.1 hypothetical protein AVM03_03390 [Bacillus amyloliquefaciens]ASZ03617.1 hypothetical protein CJP14_06940 [Bacillus velezensis]KMN57123.1 hypothetical protein VK94_05405 [Bacillus sp. LK7]